MFRDRHSAGRELGRRLAGLGLDGKLLVLALPRGGVPVACEVARELGAPIDVLVVRKLGAPFNPELAVGATALGGVTIYNDDLLAQLGLTEQALAPILERELAELERRERAYRGDKPAPDVKDKTVIIVDDGVATGATMHAAVRAARKLGPRKIIAATPTAARDSVIRLEQVADRVIALAVPEPYYGVGAWYEEFPQLTDDEVLACLARAARPDEVAARGDARRSV